MKRAFITGIAGQDGSYLAELLLEKDYDVHGLVHGVAGLSAPRLQHLFGDKHLHLYPGDLDDAATVQSALEQSTPDEIYHLAGLSHVGRSFDTIEQTCQITAMGTLRLLELFRKLNQPARFFHASSSEIFGSPAHAPQDENTELSPITPYGCARAFATNLARIYRKTYGLFVANGILFNHESPRRDAYFVTKKICCAAAEIKLGRRSELSLGDLSAQRDWGHARDYVRGMWLSLQHDEPEDFVFATNQQHAVQEIVEIAFRVAGLEWREFVRHDPQLLRRADPCRLVGNAAKAKSLLGWQLTTTFEQLITEMTQAELQSHQS